MEFSVSPIGVIHTPFASPAETPLQAAKSQAAGRIELYPEFEPGLKDIEGLSHLILLYVFHQSEGYELQIKPFLDDQVHGLFATRYPFRPNRIGLSIVTLVERQQNVLHVEGIDVVDGTPLIDIKPYVPEFDTRENVRTGWYETRKLKDVGQPPPRQ